MTASMDDGRIKLMFQPYSSILNPGFWQQLTNLKLNKLKFSTEPVEIHGTYSCNLSDNLPCLASFDQNSFGTRVDMGSRSSSPLYGQFVCLNIMQEFIDLDKKETLNSAGSKIWKSICDGSALSEPEKYLSRFELLVYADLKKYKFYYWFAFPVINYPKEIFYQQSCSNSSTQSRSLSRPITDFLTEDSIKMLQAQYDRNDSDRTFQRGYFIVLHNKISGVVECYPLTQFREISLEQQSKQSEMTLYFAYTDPSPSSIHPGWPMRNFLSLIAVQFQLNQINIIRIRRGVPSAQCACELHQSMVLRVTFQLDESVNPSLPNMVNQLPLITGWEKNESQQIAPKRVNLSSLLDPRKLNEDAVNLNLRLMKWRLLPTLDLEKISQTKCLLLGCGTLGCHIARGLLAWGIKYITIVDNSRISYSNPVRQSLYTFDDCFASNGGKFKADAAAASLKKIHPSVTVNAHVLSIPMPGHHVAPNEIDQTKQDVMLLESLIESHDATFLLMDTRESRWLPTVIAMSKQKLVINAAIGFDTFLLQRFGIRDYAGESETRTDLGNLNTSQGYPTPSSSSGDSEIKNTQCQLESCKLGCYFCNDIVAPGDSTLDRTLDQQCTVSRPGVSMIVSAMAVELLASIISSDRGALTPAPLELNRDQSMLNDGDFGSDLGIVPHSIRGNISRYYIYMPTSPFFNKCSACSTAVIKFYRELGYEFLHRVFNDPSYLEEVAGLKDLQNVNDDVWALDSDEILFDDSVE